MYKMAFALLMGLQMGFIFLNLPPVLETILKLYSISYIQISVLLSALLWSHALIQIPGGVITDRIGLRKALIVSLIFTGIGGFVPAAIPSLNIAIIGRVVSGIGTGFGFIATMKLVALYAPAGRVGTFQAFFGGSFSIGSILAYLFIPHIAVSGWQWIYLSTGVLSLPLLAMLLPMDLRIKNLSLSTPIPLNKLFRIRLGWVIGLYHALSYGSVINLGNWVPTLFAESWQGSDTSEFIWGGPLVMMISGLGRLSGGFALYWFRSSLISNGTIFVLCLIFLGLFLISNPQIVFILALMGALFASINFGSFFDIASRSIGSESLGSFLGFINLLANLGAILFTLTFGWFKDVFGILSIGFASLSICCIFALFFGRKIIKDTANR